MNSKHIVHQDIKPDNILLSTKDKVAKINDFGISVIVDPNSNYDYVYNGPINTNLITPEHILWRPISSKTDSF